VRDTNRQQTPSPVAGREPEPSQGEDIRARSAWREADVLILTHVEVPGNGMEGETVVADLLPRVRLVLPNSKLSRGSLISLRSTHQLESRMREICLSGSGEGAVLPRPYLIN
jgi:hypothetical protein